MDAALYRSLRSGVGIVRLPPRTQVELTGDDRASFLNGLCTNDVRRLAPGQGCEAFLTDVRGRTVGYVDVHCRPDSLILETAMGQAETILDLVERYQIREDVETRDRSDELAELMIAGADARQWLEQLLGQPPPQGNSDLDVEGVAVSLRSVAFAGPGSFFLSCAAEQREALCATCLSSGAIDGGSTWVDVARIEAGTPLFGTDVTADNLPQEVNRNVQAISFTKGCYLGQETIARIDARGHVNRLLVGLRLEVQHLPAPGTVLTSGGTPMARITSVCWSPALDAPLALAYVRRGSHLAGSVLDGDGLRATVTELPLRHA